MGRDCASERVQSRWQRADQRTPGPAELWGARALNLDQPLDDIAVALARPPHRLEPVDNIGRQPHVPFTALVGLVFVADAARRERSGNCLKGVGADREADFVRPASPPAQPRRA